MKALIGGCLLPDFVFGSLHSTSADSATMFMAKAKRETEMLQPVMIRFSSLPFSVPDLNYVRRDKMLKTLLLSSTMV